MIPAGMLPQIVDTPVRGRPILPGVFHAGGLVGGEVKSGDEASHSPLIQLIVGWGSSQVM